MNKFFKTFVKVIKVNLFDFSKDYTVPTIEELRALRILKKNTDENKNFRKYISEINKRHQEWKDKKNKKIFI